MCLLLMLATVINYMDRMALNQMAKRDQGSIRADNTAVQPARERLLLRVRNRGDHRRATSWTRSASGGCTRSWCSGGPPPAC